MKKLDSNSLDFGYFMYRVINPIFDPVNFLYSIPRYSRYIYDLIKYTVMQGAEPLRLLDLYPKIHERTPQTHLDHHYFYQDTWAGKKIYASRTKHHYDIGSLFSLIGHLTTFTKVTFIDIRPPDLTIKNLDSQKGDILHLPFTDNSISSLSCLHVAEHIGLGRYGDRLDPHGTKKACKELSRVLARHGKLYFSLPVGRPRVCFNAHRIHSLTRILEYFKDLELVELSGIDDEGNLREHIDRRILEHAHYACGLFIFTKNN